MPPHKILIVDDSPTVSAVLQQQLEQAGFVVATHGHGLGTVAAVLREQPELILLDVSMKALPGDQICKLIKKNGSDVRIYLHSSIEEPELRERAREAGADGYIPKSWGSEKVIEVLRAAFNGSPPTE